MYNLYRFFIIESEVVWDVRKGRVLYEGGSLELDIFFFIS